MQRDADIPIELELVEDEGVLGSIANKSVEEGYYVGRLADA